MAFEHRDGTCERCGGRIYRYPHPRADQPDVWAHLDRDDWLGTNPHDPVPRMDAECSCGGGLAQHPAIPERWAHIDKTDVDGEHDAAPKVVA